VHLFKVANPTVSSFFPAYAETEASYISISANRPIVDSISVMEAQGNIIDDQTHDFASFLFPGVSLLLGLNP
jgi:hypothetical protein